MSVKYILVIYKINQFSSKIHVLENPNWYPLKFAHTLRRPDTGTPPLDENHGLHSWSRKIAGISTGQAAGQDLTFCVAAPWINLSLPEINMSKYKGRCFSVAHL